MCTSQNYSAAIASANNAVPTVQQTSPKALQVALVPSGSPFPRNASLVDYFERTLYSHLFRPDTPIYSDEELALHLLKQFEAKLGVATYSEWVNSYCAEVIYLFNLIGQTPVRALLVLRSDAVCTTLHALYKRQQSTADHSLTFA